MKEKVLVIVGPTAVGKTALSIELAQKYQGEVISADSMQVYKELSIGTAKVSAEEMAGIPHHLLDFLDLDQAYNASLFQEMAQEKIQEIRKRGHLPIVVGGTGLYIEGLLYDLGFGGDSTSDGRIRQVLENRLREEGVEALYAELLSKDPLAAEKIPISNSRRLIRALEVIEATGQAFSSQQDRLPDRQSRYDAFVIGLNTEREVLYDRINQRVDAMLEAGLLDEVDYLLNKAPESPLAKAIGYKELFAYKKGLMSQEEAVELLKQQSRRYAKRQLTWFRNRMEVHWVDPFQEGFDTISKEVAAWLKTEKKSF